MSFFMFFFRIIKLMFLLNNYLDNDSILKCLNNIYEICFWYYGYCDIVIYIDKEI